MTVEHELREGRLVVRPIGRLDAGNSPDVRTLLGEHFETGVRRLVFDLGQLDYVSAAGLRVILLAASELQESDGRLAIAGLCHAVRELFEVTGFMDLLPVLPTVADAMANLRE